MSVDLGSQIRMAQNALQSINSGARPPTAERSVATVSNATADDASIDWRVSLSVPNEFQSSPILTPFGNTDNKMIFPFNPQVLLGHTANYNLIDPTHNNFPYHAYQNSQVDNITLTGEFFTENQEDAKYWIACVHFLRSATKMFYGEGNDPQGNPPIISRLNGYGKHVLNNIPVVITNFTTDISNDVDYIECEVGNGEVNYVPTQSVITVTCAPNYARRQQARFSLNKYVNGEFIGGPEGFV